MAAKFSLPTDQGEMTVQEQQIHLEPDTLPRRTVVGLARVDAMPADLRRCVHEFGLPIVDACMQAGITKPEKIRQFVHEIWAGTRETWRQKSSGASGLVSKLDWLLSQAGSTINALALVRVLYQSNYVIVPTAPWACMVNASLEEVTFHGPIRSKEEKHRLRLVAAVRAAVKYAWPHLER